EVSPPLRVARFAIPIGISGSASGRALAISPDGTRIAAVTDRGLVVRVRDQLDTFRLSGLSAPGAGAPFFSPDGQWIGLTDGQTLKKVPSAGGPAVQIAESGPAAIASWDVDGIVFGDMNGLFYLEPKADAPRNLQLRLGANEQ